MFFSNSGIKKDILHKASFNEILKMCLCSDNLAPRIVWTMLVEIVVLIITIVLAMVETSSWPTPFFYLTIGCVVVLNMANGIYQNTVFGLAARLPVKYTGAVVLGSVSFLGEKL